MATKIRLLKNAGIPFYPQTVDKAIYVGSENKTLDAVLADLVAADVTVDTVLNVASGNPIANKAVKAELDKKLGITAIEDEKGYNDGICPLGFDGKVPSSFLPSFVDDVIELLNLGSDPLEGIPGQYFYNETLTSKWNTNPENAKKLKMIRVTSNNSKFGTITDITPVVIEAGKIYINLADNKTYRWSGSTMVVISETLALGETPSTAYPGHKGKMNADNISMLTDRVDSIEGKANEQDDAIIEIRGIANANKATILAHAKEYTALNNSLTAEKAKTVTLQSKMGTAETNISNLTTSVQSLNTGLGSANTNIDAVKTRVATIEAAYITCQDTGGEVAYSIPAGIYQ